MAWWLCRLLVLAVYCLSVARADPFIFYRGILNAASYAPSGLPNGSIARGSIFAIFGRALGPADGATVSSFPLGTAFQNVSIEVCQAGNCLQAIPLYVQAGQINAIMPSNAPLGAVSLRVTFNGTAGNFSPATVVASSFGAFAINSGGFGPGVVQNFTPNALPINSAVATASPGQTVIAWGTGLGAGLKADNVAPQAGDLPVPVEIWAGGKPVTVKRYSGRTPCCAGIDQIVFDLPPDTPTGCYVPVTIRAGGVVSNSVTVAVSSNGASPCVDPANPFNAARAGGRVGVVLLSRFHTTAPLGLDLTSDLVAAMLQEETAGPSHFNRLYSLPAPGSCTTYAMPGAELTTSLLANLAANGRLLSAGSELSVNGPGGSVAALPLPAARNFYGALAAPDVPFAQLMSLLLGENAASRVSAPGGSDVGAFQVEMTPPPRLTWTNREALATLRRGDALDLTWTGGDPQGLVVIAGFGRDRASLSSSGFVCTERASQGSLAVQGWITAALSGGGESEQTNGIVVLSALPANAAPFSAGGLDIAFGILTSSQARGVHVQ